MTQLAVFVLLLATWMLPGGAIAQIGRAHV